MSWNSSIKTLIFLVALLPSSLMAADFLKPVLTQDFPWKPVSLSSSTGDGLSLFDEDDGNKKIADEYKAAFTRLNKNQNHQNQSKDVATLRQNALKLGPKAKLIAELMAGRIGAGLNSAGSKVASPSGNWRGHLLAACNIAAKIDEKMHEQTVMQALAIWRRADPRDTSWAAPPVDIKGQKQFTFYKAVLERQAIYDWSKGASATALKKYRNLSQSFNGSIEGGMLDLRIIELEKQLFVKSKQLRRWQRVLVDFSEKYKDPQVLGNGNEAKAQQISSNIAKTHRELVDTLVREAMSHRATELDRGVAIKSIDLYLTTNISEPEKERVRAASGEIQYSAKHHKAAAGIFAALATETEGSKSQNYWRKAIRSQLELAQWPPHPPWSETPKGPSEPRVILLDMFSKVEPDSTQTWDTIAQIGLLQIATGQPDEAYQFWMTKLSKSPSGANAAHAAGWIADARIKNKQWSDLENLGRIILKAKLSAVRHKNSYRPGEVLSLALIEGGLQAMANSDYKSAVSKLEEFVKNWRQNARHDEGMYNLSLAYHGAHEYRTAVTSLEDFTKAYRRSKYRQEALRKGGDWTLALAWNEHVMYFLEAHAREFPEDPESKNSLRTLTDLYLGSEIYDAALRVMNTLLDRKGLDADARSDVARQLMDTAERHASSDNALRLAQRLQNAFKNDSVITATALSLRARIQAERGNLREMYAIDKVASQLDQSQPIIAEIFAEIKFRLAETLSRNEFKEEVFSLAAKDPKAEIERGYGIYSKIDQAYKAACLSVRTGWCGPALHRTARVGEQFVKAYDQLSIAKNLEPKIVKDFYARKKSILESVENQSMESDEKSLEQARSGATNPEWTSAIMWQNGEDWSRENFTSENADHFIQWRTR